jgi:hypothetical protein
LGKKIAPSGGLLYKQITKITPQGIFAALKISISDWRSIKNKPIKDNIFHCQAAMDWLCAGQDAANDGGIPESFVVLTQTWLASYPETTGYAIPTFFDYYHQTGNEDYRIRALKMADWEISVQMENGACRGGNVAFMPLKPAVFNTGQILYGFVRAYKETGEEKYRQAAIKAADWLVKNQDNDGAWRKELSAKTNSPVQVYNTKSAWGLLQVFDITSKKIYQYAAQKNIDWALKQQLPNGWFQNATFNTKENPLLHTLAYTIEGILECGVYLKNDLYIKTAQKSADALLKLQKKDGSLSGVFDPEWKATVNWNCLTGDAQMSCNWLRLYELTTDAFYYKAAQHMNDYLKRTQDIKSNNKGIRGGIKGSKPIFGSYAPFSYVNWAAKYFIDALLLEEKIEKRIAKQ